MTTDRKEKTSRTELWGTSVSGWGRGGAASEESQVYGMKKPRSEGCVGSPVEKVFKEGRRDQMVSVFAG